MKKQDLKNGMVVQIRDGRKYILLKEVNLYPSYDDALFSLENGCFIRLDSLDNDLKDRDGVTKYDIVKIFISEYIGDMVKKNPIRHLNLIWEREETKEVTMEELEEILGYPIKIKK